MSMSNAAPRVNDSDLIVIGAGAAGMTAALVGALEGYKVTLYEASEQVGGTTATSAGTLWIPGNSQGLRAGHDDSLEKAHTYLNALIGPDDQHGLRAAYLSSAAQAIDYLQAHSAVEFISSGTHPDYLDLKGAAQAGRAISPAQFDGRLLGAEFDRVRPPIPHFMVLGGLMVGKADIQALLGRFQSFSHFFHSARIVGRYAFDRFKGYGRGTRLVMGNALVAQLLFSLRCVGVKIVYGARCQKLLLQEGRVTGALMLHKNGELHASHARIGVVLCAGGIGHHPQLRHAFGVTAQGSHSLSFKGNRGEGIDVACAIGAALKRSAPDFLWQPVSKIPETRDYPSSLYPHLFLDRAKPGLIAVNRTGRRFVNEGVSYHHFVEGMLQASEATPSLCPAYLICNADFVKRYGLGAIHPGTKNLKDWAARGYISLADTIESLAIQLNVDANGLRASVEQMNQAAAQGHDSRFGKGSTAVSRFNGDPGHTPNPCLAALGSGPYVGLEVWPGESASSSGLLTTADGQVLDKAGHVISGLYACGNDMASIWHGHYPGPGATLGPAMVFAYRIIQGLSARRT